MTAGVKWPTAPRPVCEYPVASVGRGLPPRGPNTGPLSPGAGPGRRRAGSRAEFYWTPSGNYLITTNYAAWPLEVWVFLRGPGKAPPPPGQSHLLWGAGGVQGLCLGGGSHPGIAVPDFQALRGGGLGVSPGMHWPASQPDRRPACPGASAGRPPVMAGRPLPFNFSSFLM